MTGGSDTNGLPLRDLVLLLHTKVDGMLADHETRLRDLEWSQRAETGGRRRMTGFRASLVTVISLAVALGAVAVDFVGRIIIRH